MDESGNWSALSNGATAYSKSTDVTPPGAITTLSALTGQTAGTIKLNWLAPGNDGYSGDIVGGQYSIRYASYTTGVTWSTYTPPT